MARERSRHEIVIAYAFCSAFLVAIVHEFGLVPKDWYGFTAFVFWCIGAMYGLYETRDKNINTQEIQEVEGHEAVEIEKEMNAPVYEEFQFFKDKPKQP